MLHIYKGVDNNLIFTGLELATISNPKYLFIFTSATEDSVIFVGTNISTEDRYQKVLVLKAVFDNQESGQTSTENDDELNQVSGGFVGEAVGAVIGASLNLANTKISINGQKDLSAQGHKQRMEEIKFTVDEQIRLLEANRRIFSN